MAKKKRRKRKGDRGKVASTSSTTYYTPARSSHNGTEGRRGRRKEGDKNDDRSAGDGLTRQRRSSRKKKMSAIGGLRLAKEEIVAKRGDASFLTPLQRK